MKGLGLAAAALTTIPTLLAAQQANYDAVLSIRREGREIGREEMSVRPGRGPDGRTAGSTISTHVRYPAFGPQAEFAGVLERTPAGRPTVFQLEYHGPGGDVRFLAAYEGRRIIVHRFSGGNQAAKEYPAGTFPAFLVDSSYAFYAALAAAATPEGREVSAVFPREGRRVGITVTAAAAEGGLREVRLAGGLSGSLWVDRAGALQRIELPEQGIAVVRLTE